MKFMKYNCLFLALHALMLAACSSEEPVAGNGTDEAAIVTAGIATVMPSRACNAAWSAGDRIGISGKSGNVTYTNVPYVTTEGDGAFASLNGVAQGIFLQNVKPATFSAYYPYNENINAEVGVISANTTVQKSATHEEEFDFLFASGATASVANPSLKFTGDAAFSHRMAQLVLNITPDQNAGFNGEEIITNGVSTLSGLCVEGEFHTSTGLAKAIGTPADWTLTGNVTNNSGIFSMIVFPQTANDAGYAINYNGVTYACDLPLNLEAGHRYTYNIKLKKTGLSVTTSSINDWTDGGTTEGDITMTTPVGNEHPFLSTKW